jgi:predicted site-specific integrase-resolvase
VSEYIGPSEAGRIAGVSSQTIRDWVAAGKLPALHTSIGRVFEAATVERLALERAAQQQFGGRRPRRAIGAAETVEA